MNIDKCKECNCNCHCNVKEHSDLYGVCPCEDCKCENPKNEGEECLSCQPTDQEQFMLIENLYKVTEKLELTQEQNMTNKVNIQFLRDQLEKALVDIENLKDKVRQNGNGHD